MVSKYSGNYNGLIWVKDELSQALESSLQSIKTFIELPSDTTPLSPCIEQLEQVSGVVDMLGLQGSFLLTEETLLSAKSLNQTNPENASDISDSILKALLVLSNYISLINADFKDHPIKLLETINELRSARSETALLASDLVYIDYSLPLANEITAPSHLEVVNGLTLEKANNAFQILFLRWIKSNDLTSLKKLYRVIQYLHQTSNNPQSILLWVLAENVIESVISANLLVSNQIKLTLGKLNQPVKLFTKGGEQEFIAHYPESLIRELVLLIAKSSSTAPRSVSLKTLFEADFYDQKQHQQIYNFGENALSEATQAIIEQLQETKVHIDELHRDSNISESSIETISKELETIANTLDLLSETNVSELIKQQVERVHQLVEPSFQNEEHILNIANALLSAEHQLQLGKQDQDDSNSDLKITVITECLNELVHIKEALIQVSENNQTSESLSDAPSQLALIAGSMMMLNQNQATSLLENAATCISNEQLTDNPENLALFADVLTTIEFYLEGIMEHGQNRSELLTNAQKQLDLLQANPASQVLTQASDLSIHTDDSSEPLETVTLSLAPETLDSTETNTDSDTTDNYVLEEERHDIELTLEPIAFIQPHSEISSVQRYIDKLDNTPPATPELTTQVAELSLSKLTDTDTLSSVQRYIDNINTQVKSVTNDEVTSNQTDNKFIQTLELYVNDSSGSQDSSDTTLTSTPLDEDTSLNSDQMHFAEGIDHEIAEVFIEEAQEVLLELSSLIPNWLNTDDIETLSTIRRHYHTLKGSGRMAGATVIGELAWSIESTLNTVLEQQLIATSDLKTLLNDSFVLIPDLVTRFSQGEMNTSDEVEQLIVRAEMLLNPTEKLSETNELQHIFNIEAQQHLATLNNALSNNEQPFEINKEIIRAAHSLKGCANIANALAVGSIATELESTLSTLYESDLQLNEDQQSLLSQTLIGIAQVVAHHNDSSAFEPDLRQLSANLTTLKPNINLEKNIDPEFLAVLLEETDELLEQYNQQIARVKNDPTNSDYQNDIKHTLSLLRQSATDAKLETLGDVYGLIEQLLLFSLSSQQDIDFNLFDLGYEQVLVQVEAVMQNQPAPDISTFKHTIENALNHTDFTEQSATPTLSLEPENPATPEVDNDLLNAFIEECSELLESSGQAIKQWSLDLNDQNASMQLQRDLHTIKGGARLTEIIPIADLSHQTESLVLYAIEQNQTSSPAFLSLLQRCQDSLADMLDSLMQHQPLTLATELLADIDGYFNQDTENELLTPQPEQSFTEKLANIQVTPEIISASTVTNDALENAHVSSHVEHVRVRADLLDYLTNFAGEVNISRDRVSQQNMAIQQQLGEMEATIERLQDQLRNLEIETETQILFRYEHESVDKKSDFDPLELDRFSMIQQLSRGLTESVSDLNNINGSLTNLVRDSDTILLQQSRLSTGIHQSLMNTRLLPFKDLVSRLERIVRQTNLSTNKECELTVSGAEHELDRSVLDKLVAPIEHILRNAIAHGIETPEQRLAAGKTKSGQLSLAISREGSEILVALSDDGQGINIDKIREKALQENLIDPNRIPDDDSLIQLILTSGFSTADDISQLSGRGVGMDVVNNEIRALKGRLSIKSQTGQGTSFNIRLPLSLSVMQALLVNSFNQQYAIPLSAVDTVERVPVEIIHALTKQPDQASYRFNDIEYDFYTLAGLLDLPLVLPEAKAEKMPLLLFKYDDKHIALLVDKITSNREIVLKSAGPQLSQISAINGATILGDGQVIFVLDIPALIDNNTQSETPIYNELTVQEPLKQKLIAMVVDDSITMRKASSNLLNRYGFEVITAKDGIDAIAKLHNGLPDIILLDVEMPRMDGFEFATFVRNDALAKDIPIIMITSRTGDKHRGRASNIGVNAYMGKPYQELELISSVQELLGDRVELIKE